MHAAWNGRPSPAVTHVGSGTEFHPRAVTGWGGERFLTVLGHFKETVSIGAMQPGDEPDEEPVRLERLVVGAFLHR